MKVLILEDEEGIRRFVRIHLERQGMTVIEAITGEEALEKYREHPDVRVAVVDVMLPGMDGFEVCRELRRQDEELGIIILTAKKQDRDKLTGFDSGADDYVSKPFSPQELAARIEVLARRVRKGPVKDGEIHLGPFTLDLRRRVVLKHRQPVALSPKEYEIVKLLMEKSGTAVSRDEILEKVWGKYFTGDLKTVDIHIARIRKKMEETPSAPRFIETVRGYGYLWRKDPT
ncbi:response regulator transcription factor [Staphylospora marina]|uniref:response regulator transcription factor n=1 Tax=Staphylospora marina TaxID=2490858 RepID=UPI0019D2CC97|nr:response regulator transcription factor [Staphylospora marina]